jgi:hypothetical protein
VALQATPRPSVVEPPAAPVSPIDAVLAEAAATLDATAQLPTVSSVASPAPVTRPDARVTKPRRAPKPVVARTPTAFAATATAPKPRRLASSSIRRRATIPALSFFAVFGFVGGSLVNPLSASIASASVIAAPVSLRTAPPQSYSAHGTYATASTARDGYGVTKPAPVVTKTTTTTTTSTSSSASTSSSSSSSAPAAGTPDPGSAQAIAQQMVTARGWDTSQYNCLVSLWNRESGWNVYAYNPSGAYGIPQALPGSKMATVGADWQTNPATQITWGLNYITGSYGTPCGAWAHSQAYNWY